ncbi:MAG: ABC transporter permease [Defluviitaleaceae bacterium]|nr:ABC transporter permease [Defluviitaleaceae bacterium]
MDVNKTPSPFRVMCREIYKDKLAFCSLIVFFTVLIGVFIWAALLDTSEVMRQHLLRGNLPPSREFWLGTDSTGRDTFNLLILGTRNSFIIALIVASITSVIGIVVGLAAGYYGGHVDNVVMRLIDFMTMIPTLMFIITMTVLLPNTIRNFGLILTVFGWTGMARSIRMVSLRQGVMDYVKASKTLGSRNIVIMFREVLPNILSFTIVNLTLSIATTMGIETGLTFLGFGPPPTMPTLGLAVANAANPLAMQLRPWLWLPAALVILVMVLCINYVGQAIGRAADARRRRV